MHVLRACQQQMHLPMFATQLFFFFTIDSSNFDDALEGLGRFGPVRSQLLAVPTPTDMTSQSCLHVKNNLQTCHRHITEVHCMNQASGRLSNTVCSKQSSCFKWRRQACLRCFQPLDGAIMRQCINMMAQTWLLDNGMD